MKLDLRTLASGSGKITIPIDIHAVDAGLLRPNDNGTLEITYDNRETSLTGTAYARIVLLIECARCLREFTFPVEAEFRFTAKTGKPDEEEDDENTLFFTEAEPVVELTALVSEELAVNIPMMPVCDEACRGLCPGCGADLNTKECGCKPAETHPAWDALKKLKQKREK